MFEKDFHWTLNLETSTCNYFWKSYYWIRHACKKDVCKDCGVKCIHKKKKCLVSIALNIVKGVFIDKSSHYDPATETFFLDKNISMLSITFRDKTY